MTINKAQGQTIPNVGVYLPEPVFSHGQLYVALSRATSRSNIRILTLPPNAEENRKYSNKKEKKKPNKKVKKKIPATDGTYTKNIVYKEVLTP
jgi:ATP-dependent exoDNAse (exonuclease V) alpha subunit